MHRSSFPLTPVVLSLLMTACGNVVFDPNANGGGKDPSDGATATAGVADGSGGSSAETSTGSGGERACDPPPSPSPMPDPPPEPGCYVNEGDGWLAVPCSCELWMDSYLPTESTVTVQLDVTPADPAPTLDGPVDVEIAFEDADERWFATWVAQPDHGVAFTVAAEGGKTIVRMGRSSVTLAPVAIDACGSRRANAIVAGTGFSTTLAMKAVITDGLTSSESDGVCTPPPPPRPPPPP